MKKVLTAIFILIIINTFLTIGSFFIRLGVNGISDIHISTYVPGKSPRYNGFPYIIGTRTINKDGNRCIYGYVNLITYEGQFSEDVCEIIG